MSGQTPSQTVGPFFAMMLARDGENVLVSGDHPDRIHVTGIVRDGDNDPVEDALVEVWQADGDGRFNHPDDRPRASGFTGYGRARSETGTGVWWFDTIKPGRVPDPEGEPQAPHLSLIVQGRGMLNPTFTRMYFPDEAEANDHDLVLRSVPSGRRRTLVAERVDAADVPTYRFDIRYQGPDETVFLEF